MPEQAVIITVMQSKGPVLLLLTFSYLGVYVFSVYWFNRLLPEANEGTRFKMHYSWTFQVVKGKNSAWTYCPLICVSAQLWVYLVLLQFQHFILSSSVRLHLKKANSLASHNMDRPQSKQAMLIVRNHWFTCIKEQYSRWATVWVLTLTR